MKAHPVRENFVLIDRGWDNLIKKLRSAGHSFTKVGLPSDGKPHGERSMDEMIDIGITHEFGYEPRNIPMRSFMASTMDENREKVSELQAEAISSLALGVTVRQALFKIGEEVKSMIGQKLLHGPFEALKQSTIDKKGHSIPLYETGQLRDDIQHIEEVHGAY